MKKPAEKNLVVPQSRMGEPEIETMLTDSPGTIRIRLERCGGKVRLTVYSRHTDWCDRLVENGGTAEINSEQCG
ncbi:MAG: hypothetical protein E3J72_15230 [Planctomycetota bacterium]|nr:MAG: hypothetical protein E3J72_15230 [Planctomycetota bacterium]